MTWEQRFAKGREKRGKETHQVGVGGGVWFQGFDLLLYLNFIYDSSVIPDFTFINRKHVYKDETLVRQM